MQTITKMILLCSAILFSSFCFAADPVEAAKEEAAYTTERAETLKAVDESRSAVVKSAGFFEKTGYYAKTVIGETVSADGAVIVVPGSLLMSAGDYMTPQSRKAYLAERKAAGEAVDVKYGRDEKTLKAKEEQKKATEKKVAVL